MPPSQSRLSKGQSVLNLLKQINRPQSKLTATSDIFPNSLSQNCDGGGATFNDHPLYQDLMQQAALADRYSLSNPYYQLFTPASSASEIGLASQSLSNYTSYDYLDLNHHPAIHQAAFEAIERYGTSVNGSRLTSGERAIHRELEQALASHYGADDAIAFSSGHAGALSTISTLAQPEDLILYDAYSHNCITLGAKYSGAARRAFTHNDVKQLEAHLKRDRSRYRQVFIVSEGLFSMDGDMAPLSELIDLKKRYQCYLMIDDAHGLGVLGSCGRGVFEAQNVSPSDVDLWFGTLSKTLVSAGGYLAGSRAAIAILRAYAPGLVYTVGLSPTLAATALRALQLIEEEPDRIERLQSNSSWFYQEARRLGFDTGYAIGTGILPIHMSDVRQTLTSWKRLQDRGVASFPVLPPGVPANGSRLRFFVTAAHQPERITADLATLAAIRTMS